MEAFIAKLPKAELHVHLEGTMTTDTLLRLAQRNNIDVGTREDIEKRRSSYSNFQDFVVEYDITSSVIVNGQDLYDVAYDYFLVCHAENILYTEIFFCPALFHDRNISFHDAFEPLLRASRDAEVNLNVRSNWIMCIVKHISMESNRRMLEESIPYSSKIIGIGIAGVEVGIPARLFEGLYEDARKIGYTNFTAHSGESGDPRCIIDTLYHLKVKRIDHGVRCLEDPFLLKFLAESDIWLTVCPLSNFHLGVLDRYFDGKHIVHLLIEKGIKITINSDDPPLLGGFLNKNYLTVAEMFDEKTEDEVKEILGKLAKDSFRASYLDEASKEFFIGQVTNYMNSLSKH